MNNIPDPLKKPLVFGDSQQFHAIKEMERAQEKKETMCEECTGEGMIECFACHGSGLKNRKHWDKT